MHRLKSICIAVIILASVQACSSDTVKVSTSSSSPAVSEDGSGAAISVSGSSADGSSNVTGGQSGNSSGGTSQNQTIATAGGGSGGVGSGRHLDASEDTRSYTYRFITTEVGLHTFCLEEQTAEAENTSVQLRGEAGLLFELSSPGCAATEIIEKETILTIRTSFPGANVSLCRVPSFEIFPEEKDDAPETMITLIQTAPEDPSRR